MVQVVVKRGMKPSDFGDNRSALETALLVRTRLSIRIKDLILKGVQLSNITFNSECSIIGNQR